MPFFGRQEVHIMMYVMQVLTGKEEYVSGCVKDWLLQDGEEAYSPTCEREIMLHGKPTPVTARVFPGYIFIQSENVIDLYFRIRKTKDRHFLQTLTKVLRTDETFTPMSEAEEHAFLSLFGPDHKAGISRGVIRGGKLKVLDGPLKGKEDSIIKIDRHKRLAILQMRILGRYMTVKVGLEVAEKE
jgi:transcriptional antiterminator NusG